jgi:hypothetical protein
MSAWSCVVETRETLFEEQKNVLRRPYPIDLNAMLANLRRERANKGDQQSSSLGIASISASPANRVTSLTYDILELKRRAWRGRIPTRQSVATVMGVSPLSAGELRRSHVTGSFFLFKNYHDA